MKVLASIWTPHPGAIPTLEPYSSIKSVIKDFKDFYEFTKRIGGIEPIALIYYTDNDYPFLSLGIGKNGGIRVNKLN